MFSQLSQNIVGKIITEWDVIVMASDSLTDSSNTRLRTVRILPGFQNPGAFEKARRRCARGLGNPTSSVT